jgi:hypothetical protein
METIMPVAVATACLLAASAILIKRSDRGPIPGRDISPCRRGFDLPECGSNFGHSLILSCSSSLFRSVPGASKSSSPAHQARKSGRQ